MARHAATLPWLDTQGLLRFPPDANAWIDPECTPFVSLFADASGKQVGIAPSNTAQPGSFRLLNVGGRPALYLKSALHAAGMSLLPGILELKREKDLLIVRRPEESTSLLPHWIPVHCRSSADIPMVALDTRGTLTLDRLCLRALEPFPRSVDPHFDEATGTLTLRFAPDGPLAVRVVANRAEISLRGTLSFLGWPLPARRVRYTARLQDNTLRFNLKQPFLTHRPQ